MPQISEKDKQLFEDITKIYDLSMDEIGLLIQLATALNVLNIKSDKRTAKVLSAMAMWADGRE